MNKINLPLRIALTTVWLTTACLSGLPMATSVPAPASSTPNLALTSRVQTLTAAPTLTLINTPILATETATMTLTPFPSITPLPTETATATKTPFGYRPTATPGDPSILDLTKTPDPNEGFTAPEGSDYRCLLVSKSLDDWVVVPPDSMYKISWDLLNIGKKVWDNGVKLVFVDGERMNAEKTVDLRKDVKFGQDINVVNTLYTPKAPGQYRGVWGLMVMKNKNLFCTFTVKITIQ